MDRTGLSLRVVSLGVVVALLPLGMSSGGDEKEDAPPASPESFLLTGEEITAVLELFHASSEELEADGRIQLIYDFERRTKDLAEDWLPALDEKKPEIRWAKGHDGAAEGVGGILLADTGQWFHEAVFLPDVELDIEFMSFCGGARGDLVCATYAWSQMKKRIGSNLGSQCLALAGTKAAGTVDGTAPTIAYDERFVFGFRLKDGIFRYTRGSAETGKTDSSAALKKLAPGQVGLVWSGRISAAIPKITISGALDLEWVGKKVKSIGKRHAEHLEKVGKAEKGGGTR
jgi:hypothetical protein